ncbi:hypothetical protein ACQ4PT_026645 [Festuca glaucescens]
MAASVACSFFFDAEPADEPPGLALDACALCAKPLAPTATSSCTEGTPPSAARTAATSRCASTQSARGARPAGCSGTRRERRSPITASERPGRCRCRSRASRPAGARGRRKHCFKQQHLYSEEPPIWGGISCLWCSCVSRRCASALPI